MTNAIAHIVCFLYALGRILSSADDYESAHGLSVWEDVTSKCKCRTTITVNGLHTSRQSSLVTLLTRAMSMPGVNNTEVDLLIVSANYYYASRLQWRPNCVCVKVFQDSAVSDFCFAAST